MTRDRDFDRELWQWLVSQAPVTGPSGLHAAALESAGARRQRPRWLVDLRGDAFPARDGLAGHPAVATALVIVALALLLVAAAVAGAFRTEPKPLGANGQITYGVFDNKSRAGQTSFAYLMHTDGTGNQRIAAGTCPTFSANGAVMTYRTTWAGGELAVAAADGSFPRTLPFTVDTQYRDNSYALSPDGTRVAWFKPIEAIEFPQPDGTTIVPGSRNELWVAPVDGGPADRIIPVSDLPTESYGLPVWSPDGTTIAFEGYVGTPPGGEPILRRAVYLVDASGANLRLLTTRPLVVAGPSGLAWSPDGRSIAYLGLPDGSAVPSAPVLDVAFDSPAPDLFVIGADGTGAHQVTSTSAFESRPRWSPDGTRLGYLGSEDGASYALMVVPIDGSVPTGPSVRGPASVAFAWSPDGASLLSVDETTIRKFDADLSTPPTMLVDLRSWPVDPAHPDAWSTDYEHCSPSWRWLQP